VIKLQPGKFFFDSQAVITRVDKTTRRVLAKFGSYVRTTARRSIRKRKRPSKPGHPPSSHTGLLKNFIYFAYDLYSSSVVIGPEILRGPGKGEAPSILEYGGRVSQFTNTRRKKRKLGDAAEIAIGGKGARNDATTKIITDWKGRRKRVTYTRLKTAAMVAKANRLNEELYGPDKFTFGIPVAERPYMRPAFEAEKTKLPELWQDSVRV